MIKYSLKFTANQKENANFICSVEHCVFQNCDQHTLCSLLLVATITAQNSIGMQLVYSCIDCWVHADIMTIILM